MAPAEPDSSRTTFSTRSGQTDVVTPGGEPRVMSGTTTTRSSVRISTCQTRSGDSRHATTSYRPNGRKVLPRGGGSWGTAFARVGYSGDFGGSYYLTQLVGTAKARELYYTAELIDAQRALALGLVNRVVADDRLEDETMALAGKIARGPRIALRYMKRNLNAAETGSLKDLLDLEAWHHMRTGQTDDHREATKAFVEKREPVFRGR